MQFRKGMIPIEPFLSIVERERLKQDLEDDVVFAEFMELDERRIRALQDQTWISFDFADRILCKLDLVDLWWSELEEIYLACDLSPVRKVSLGGKKKRCACDGCANTFTPKPNNPHQRYCSARCREKTWDRTVRRSSRNVKKRRYDTCPNGHDRSEENTLWVKHSQTGVPVQRCRVCASERMKRYRQQRMAA